MQITKTQNGSWRELLSGKNLTYSCLLGVGILLNAVNIYISIAILPSAVNEIGGIEYYTWNTSLYLMASIIGSAISGQFLLMQKPKKAYIYALIILFIGTFICSQAPNMTTMLGGRILQGLGSGILVALSYTMILILYKEILWPKAIAFLSGIWGVATFAGPAIGGVFAELTLWRYAFTSILPIIFIYMFLIHYYLPNTYTLQNASKRTPVVQVVLLISTIGVISLIGISSNVYLTIIGIISVIVLLSIFVKIEKKAVSRLLISVQ
ncbi:MFS transporter [Myxococcota bacterium]|nr:MFS transporter [Myxococcota bacterium]MBU1413895.1 MFS transporter [Myxococcota bacterium]